MNNFPRVKLGRINGDNKYSVVLDMTIPYSAVLQERLNRLNAFVADNSLVSATALINEAGVQCSEKDVDKVLFGSKGLIPSTLASLEGRNTNRPASYSGKLTRRDGSPFFFSEDGRQYVRGVIVDGHYPLKEAKHLFTAIRNCIETNLNLPRYIRHEITEFDETVDRDANNNPR
tara:strand:- start:5 stop:526 length:522 start_codon:yes stop_codon:yes gene_type:complete